LDKFLRINSILFLPYEIENLKNQVSKYYKLLSTFETHIKEILERSKNEVNDKILDNLMNLIDDLEKCKILKFGHCL
jgi:hypothetical protein